MHAPLATLVLLAALIAGCREDAPGTLRVRVDRSKTDGRDTPRVWIRGPDGAVRRALSRDFLRKGDATSFEKLPPGRYDVACRIGERLNGPWFFVFRSVEIGPGASVESKLALPENRTTKLSVVVERGSPPMLLMLCEPESDWPKKPTLWRPDGDLGRRLSEDRFPDGLRFRIGSGAKSVYDAERNKRYGPVAVPPGNYRALVMAVDWQTGDPPVTLRSFPVTLKAGRAVDLKLTDKLRKLALEDKGGN